jgi:hypothetical protein
VPREEYPAIKRIYDLYGKGDQVEVVQIDAPHNYNLQSREAVYRFFAKHNPGLSDSRELTEHDIEAPMVQELTVLSNRTLPTGALDLDGLFALWQKLAQAQNEQAHDPAFLRNRLRQTLAVETPKDVIADTQGRSIVLSRASKKDRVPGIWIAGRNTKAAIAVVVDLNGSAAALNSDLVKKLQKEGRSILLPDVFQTGTARAPRPGDVAVGPIPKSSEDGDEEVRADAAAGYGKFFTFNVSVDAARVQDIVTAIAYAKTKGSEVEIFASADAAVWATFTAAVSDIPVSLHLDNVPELHSNSDYVQHFNVPGILRAGGLPVAQELANHP